MSDSLANLIVGIACFMLAITSIFLDQRIKALEAAMERIEIHDDITSSGRTQRPAPGSP